MNECFIICPIGDPMSEIRRCADRLLKHVLAPVLEENDYRAVRADEIAKVGLITSQIINALHTKPFGDCRFEQGKSERVL